MSNKNKEKPHHHGNLRAALVAAGVEILAESGLSGLTLRGCAARAGVSHAAPAHHFDGLSGLQSAIVARGYEIFTETMCRERAHAGGDPHARLVAICRGYLQFAEAHPALFTLMFNAGANVPDSPELHLHSSEAYEVLRQACAPFKPVGGNPANTELMIWSCVHGLASLKLGARLPSTDVRPPIPDIEEILPHVELLNQNTA